MVRRRLAVVVVVRQLAVVAAAQAVAVSMFVELKAVVPSAAVAESSMSLEPYTFLQSQLIQVFQLSESAEVW